VSSSSLPDRPSRRDGFGRGDKVVGCSSVSDTMSAFNGPAHDPPKCGRFGDNIMRQLNIWSAIGRKKWVPTFADRAPLEDAFCSGTGQITDR
jgi:hypothetical protein